MVPITILKNKHAFTRWPNTKAETRNFGIPDESFLVARNKTLDEADSELLLKGLAFVGLSLTIWNEFLLRVGFYRKQIGSSRKQQVANHIAIEIYYKTSEKSITY